MDVQPAPAQRQGDTAGADTQLEYRPSSGQLGENLHRGVSGPGFPRVGDRLVVVFGYSFAKMIFRHWRTMPWVRSLRPVYLTHRHLEVACDLGAAAAADRIDEWRRLRSDEGLCVENIVGGVRVWLRPEAADVAEDLARREAECCGFLDIALVSVGHRLRLDITPPTPDAAAVIGMLAGIEP